MTTQDEKELQELRAYKAKMESTHGQRAFTQLEAMLMQANYDPLYSPRAFKLLAECILALKEQIE